MHDVLPDNVNNTRCLKFSENFSSSIFAYLTLGNDGAGVRSFLQVMEV